MAPNKRPAADTDNDTENDTEDTEPRTAPIDVYDPNQAVSLLATWHGVYNFFKGRVDRWELTPDGIVAHGFTTSAKYDPETILRDISGRDRRIDFPNALRYFNGEAPEPFTTPSEMTNFTVNFTRGNVEGATAKTPLYVREAVAAYKTEIGLKSRRGRKRNILRLDNLNELDNEALVGTDPAQLDRLIAIAEAARAKATANHATANA